MADDKPQDDQVKDNQVQDDHAPEEQPPAQEDADEVVDQPADQVDREEAAQPEEDEVAVLKDQVLRARADFENFKRRQAEDNARTVQVARTDVILDLLPVIDNFDRAFADVPKDIDGTSWYEGVAAIKKQFEKVLEGLNIERIKTVGEQFDPELHEAIAHEASDKAENEVIKEFEAGYRLGDQVIRHARVAVSSGKPLESTNSEQDKEQDNG